MAKREPILLIDEYPTRCRKHTPRAGMTPDQLYAHNREINRQACRRRDARKKAARLGISGPPLLATPAADDVERLARHADRERRRRIDMGDAYAEADRLRNAKPKRKRQVTVAKRARYLANKSEHIAKVLAWASANPKKVRQYGLTSRARLRQRKASDPEFSALTAAARRKWESERLATDAAFRMLKTLRSSFRQCLRLYAAGRKTQSVKKIVGCTMAELVAHIESHWEPWMNWQNHGRQGLKPENGGVAWVVDHIRPCASFDLTDEAQQVACFHWSNLQPLEYFANIRKGKRLDWKK